MASLQLRAGIQSPPTIALKTIMQMLPIPCYFPRNGRRAPCGRSNCFPVMWKTNQEKEGRECERKIATHPLAGPRRAELGDAWNDPNGARIAGVRARVQSPGNVFFILFCIFLVFCHGTKQLREGSSPSAVMHRSSGSAGTSGKFGEDGQDVIWLSGSLDSGRVFSNSTSWSQNK